MKLSELLDKIPEWQRVTVTGFGVSVLYTDNEPVSVVKSVPELWDEFDGKNFNVCRVWTSNAFGDLIIEVVKE